MNLEEMIQRQQELLDAARAAGRELTAAELAEFNSLQRQIDAQAGGNDGEHGAAAGTPQQPTGGEGGERGVSGNSQQPAGAAGASGSGSPDEAVRQAAQREERERIREIQNMCRSFGMDATEYINNGTSVADARAAVMTALIQRNAPIGQRGTGDISVGVSAEDKYRAAAVDALLMRGGVIVDDINKFTM